MEKIKLRKFRALVDETGLDDFGSSGHTFKVDQLIKGKIYTQADQRFYDERGRNSDPFFVDDNGCSNDIKRAISQGRVEEVFLTIIEEENPVFVRGDLVCYKDNIGTITKISSKEVFVHFNNGHFQKFRFIYEALMAELKHFKWLTQNKD